MKMTGVVKEVLGFAHGKSPLRFSRYLRSPLQVVSKSGVFLAGIKKPALAFAKLGHNIPSLASIYKALCKLSSNQRLSSVYAYTLKNQLINSELLLLVLASYLTIVSPN